MNEGRTIFAQLVSNLPRKKFQRLVAKYATDRKMRTFSSWDQFLCMLFAQVTYRESLRDIEVCLRSLGSKLYHTGISTGISRTNLARANEKRDWRLYYEYAQHLIRLVRDIYKTDDEFQGELDTITYAFDSTIIELCLSLFPWAGIVRGRHNSYRRVIKLHTMLDLRGNIPTFIHISDGSLHDVSLFDVLPFEARALYVFDRGYFDLKRFYKITTSAAFFVTRPKKNLCYKRLSSNPKNKNQGILSDQIIRLTGTYSTHDYPENLRRISYYDASTEKRLVFLTNNFTLDAITVASLYKSRWQIELFFKWIKQHLRIKSFFGNSENAVHTQIWIAVTTYLLVAIVKKRLNLPHSLYTILQILSISCFEKTPLFQAFSPPSNILSPTDSHNQLNLLLL